ncbi:MAG: hypothetical protein ACQEWF_07765 [Bacillota bacterium]
MKKISISILLMFSSLIYLLWQVTRNPIYLKEISLNVTNPVSFHWGYIAIDTASVTNIIEGQSSAEAIHTISLLPVYAMVLASLILFFIFLKNKK